MSKTRLIAVDLDCTLLTTEKTITDFTRDTMRECRRRGILTALSTGRSFATSRRCAQIIEPDACVLSCGAAVYAGDKKIARNVIEIPRANELIEACLRVKTLKNLSVETETGLYCNSREDLAHPEFALAHYSDFSSPVDAAAICLYARLFDMQAAKEIEERFPDVAVVYFSDQYIHCFTPKGISKWAGIQVLCDYYGISAADVTYFGDDFSDREAMMNCGVGVAMANAIDPVKEIADHVTLSSDEDGVAVWIERHIFSQA